MTWFKWCLGGVIGLWTMFAVSLVTLWAVGLLDPDPETYVIDAKEVVRIFVEEEGKDLSEDEMSVAIRTIDAVVVAQAEKIYRETGSIIINKNHMLAGGVDVSRPFALQVIAAWKESRL